MGRIYRRGGRYYGDYQTPEGKRVQRSLRTTDKAVAKERLRVAELAATPQARGRRQRLSEAIDVVIKTTMHDRAAATREFYEEKARRILHTLGDPFIADITREMLAGYIARRLNKDDADHGRANPHTIQKELIVIRRALREAHELGVLPTMPAMPRFSAKYKPRETWLEPHEFETLAANLGRPRRQETKYSVARRLARGKKHKRAFEQASPDDRVLWASVAALAGASASEVESLDWADVNLETRWLKLRGTKRETRERWVPIAPALEARLRAAGPRAKGRVVKTWTSVRHGLHNACERAGLGKRVSPNDLRRTFASWLVQQGVPLLTVATLMGHSSTRMVEKVYGKLSKVNLQDAIAVLPQLFAGPPPDADQPLLPTPGSEVPDLEAMRTAIRQLGEQRDTAFARVAELEQQLDAHEDASTPAFDDIARMCGVPHWDYPGQVVRDVAMVINHAFTLRDAARRLLERVTTAVLDEGAPFLKDGSFVGRCGALEQAMAAFDTLKTDPTITPEPAATVTDAVTERVAPGTTPDHPRDDGAAD